MVLNALKFLFICLEVVVLFNLMIIVHELGHFLAARWRGLVIEKFGIWFGKPLWEKKIGGVTYSLGSIPAGGFVALPQLAPMEVMEGKVEADRNQLPPISVLDKIIVSIAGPLFSLLLAIFFAVLVWGVGRPVSESETTTTVGFVMPKSPAEDVGLRAGDRILKVDGEPVNRWNGMGKDSITWRIIRSEGETISLEVERQVEGKPTLLTFEPKPQLPETKVWNRKGLRQIQIYPAEAPVVGEIVAGTSAAESGLMPKDAIVAVNGKPVYNILDLSDMVGKAKGEPVRLGVERAGQRVETGPIRVNGAIVRELVKGFPAEAAGLQPGDRVVALNGEPVASASKLTETVRGNGTQPVKLSVTRAGKPMDVTLTPAAAEGQDKPMIGVAWEDDSGIVFDSRGRTTLAHPNPIEQLRKGAMSIFETMGAIISKKSDVKLQHMGGPVMMMRVYYSFFQMDFADGWRLAFWFSVVLNINLAMLNMLPIPVLDGGHITLALIEGIRRKPVNTRFLEIVQTGCAVMIIGFMVYILFFDVQDMFAGSGPKRARPKPVPVEPQK